MKELRYIRVINEALREEMARDERVCLLGEDVGRGEGSWSVTRGLLQEFGPDRVRDMPIIENSIIGIALGMAMAGLRPVAEIMFMDFMALAMDSIVNGLAKERYRFAGQFESPVTIRTPAGAAGGAGCDHSQSLEVWFAHVPGLKVVMPSTAYDLKGLLKSSIRDDDPVIFIEHKGLYSMKVEIPEEEYLIPLGKADVKRKGTDVTVLATAKMVFEAMKAADELARDGINIEIVDPRTISPLDKETILESVKKTGRLVIAHEAVRAFGIGGEIAAMVQEEAFDYLDAPIKRVGAAFSPLPVSKPIEDFCLPWAKDIVEAVREIVK
jgi:pyruvate dehydrogenase E1 component beta subunit